MSKKAWGFALLGLLFLPACNAIVGGKGSAIHLSDDLNIKTNPISGDNYRPDTGVQALSAHEFLNALGVGYAIPGALFNDNAVATQVHNQIVALGVKHFRGEMPGIFGTPTYLRVGALMNAGLSPILTTHLLIDHLLDDGLTVNTGSYACSADKSSGQCRTDQLLPYVYNTYNFDGVIAILKDLARDYPTSKVRCVEGPNEMASDGHNIDPSSHLKLNTYTKDLRTALSADAQLANTCVLAPTLDPTRYAKSLADPARIISWGETSSPQVYVPSYSFLSLSGVAPRDRGNIHDYQFPFPISGDCDPLKPFTPCSVVKFQNQAMGSAPASSMDVSEFGFSTCNDFVTPNLCVTEKEQADYLALRTLQMFAQGNRKMYVYSFMDSGTDQTKQGYNFGLVKYDRTPKLSYSYLQRLLARFQSSPTPVLAQKLDYSLAIADSSSANTLIFQRTDGVFLILVYRTPKSKLELNSLLSGGIQLDRVYHIKQYDLNQDAIKQDIVSSRINFDLDSVSVFEVSPN